MSLGARSTPVVALSPSMRQALLWMREAADRGEEPHGVIANTMDAPYLADRQLWMSVATGRALERRGLIRVVEASDAYLTEEGFRV